MTALFWICLVLVLFVYLGYPLLLISGLLGLRRSIRKRPITPVVSVIVPAHNEEKSIRSKILNLLEQDYPQEKIEILVGSDGSRDRTVEIVSEFTEPRLQLISSPAQQGKSAIQNRLVDAAQGDVLVFTDADCMLPRNALRVLIEPLADTQVGLVTNCASMVNENQTAVAESEGLYWRYERWLRSQESERGFLAMASGSLFAIRRELWRRLDPDVGDDFVLPLRVARAGFRNILETRVSAATQLSQDQPHSMFRMKARIISKDLRGLLRNPACLNPLSTGRVAVGLWSHKLLRWGIPYFLIGLLISSIFLAAHSAYYRYFLVAQLLFYSVSGLALLRNEKRWRFPISAAASFCLVNAASLFGTLHCLTWQPAGQWKTVR